MKALVKYDAKAGCAELREVPRPSPGPGEALVRVYAAGLCGTDMEVFRGEFPTAVPVIMGHEGAGVVEEINAGPGGADAGDDGIARGCRVALETSKQLCGRCVYCKSGRYNLCPSRKGLGYGGDGTFAEYVVVSSSRIHRLPDEIGWEEAAIIEPLSVACRAVLTIGQLSLGQSVVVVGSGPIGILVAQVARAAGARPVVLVGRSNRRRTELALELGVDHVVLTAEEPDPVGAVGRVLRGGADVVFEASGNPDATSTAIEIVRPAGRLVLVGLYPRRAAVDWNRVVTREVEVRGTWTSGVFADWRNAIKLVQARAVLLEPLITHRFTLEEWAKAFTVANGGEAVKVVLFP